jgi:5-hydroxyisourate hydrolase-like protein (transthyretin family)
MTLAGSSLAQDPGAKVELTIVDRAGAPVADATVALVAHPVDEESPAVASATTDEEGLARLSLPGGTFRARVGAEGFVERLSGVLTATAPGAPLILSMYPGAPVRGRVLDLRGNPIEGAEVCLVLARPSSFPPEAFGDTGLEARSVCVEADGEGNVESVVLPHGSYVLAVRAQDRTTIDARLRLDADTRPLEWRLRQGGSISGRLRQPDEQPISGAQLRLTHRERDAEAKGATDAEGAFRVAGLAPGRWSVRIEPPDAAVILRDGIEVREGRTTSLGTLFVRPGLHVEGRVVDSAGEPLVDAEISVREAEGVPRQLRLARTDEDGRFVAGGLPDREVNLLIDGPEGHASAALNDILPPERGLEIELMDSGTVCGVVMTDSGEVPAGVVLSATASVEGLLDVHSALVHTSTREVDAADGGFCIEDVYPADEVVVDARAPGYQTAEATVGVEPAGESEPVRLVLERGLRLHGTVVDGDGLGLREASVRTRRGAMVFTDAAGEFVLDGLQAGMNRLYAAHAEHAEAESDVMLPLPADERFVIALSEGGTIEGSVTRHDGQPAEGIAISLSRPSATRVTDADGTFRFEHVPAGSRKVSREGGGRYNDFEHREVLVADGETVRVDFELGVVLEGRLLRGGAPVPGAALILAQPRDVDEFAGGDHAVRRTYSDEQGAYRLAGVRPGWGTLSVEEPRFTTLRTIEVPAGEEPRMDVHLPDRLVIGRVVDGADERGLGGASASVTASLEATPGAPDSSNSSSHSSRDSSGYGITYYLRSTNEVQATADAEGGFEVFVEDNPEVSLYGWSSGYGAVSDMYDVSEPVVIRLARRLSVAVILEDTQGRPASNTRVCFIQIEGESRSSTCSSGGTGRVEQSLREGTFTILGSAAGFATHVVERELEAREDGAVEEIPMALIPGAPLRIRLVGTPGEEARVSALIDPAGRDRSLLVEPPVDDPATGDRSWATWPLEPGTWTIAVETGFGDTLQKTVDVVPGPAIEVSFP